MTRSVTASDGNPPSGGSNGIAAFYGWEPPRRFEWDVPSRHAGGITDSEVRACAHVTAELEAAEPGATGTIRRITPNEAGTFTGPIRWHARLEADGTIVWRSEWEPVPSGDAQRAVRAEP